MSASAQPLVSIVTVFLNGARFLPEAIESVLAQSYPQWELLLVDDGSADGSTAIARRYCAQHAGRIRYLEHAHHMNRGTTASRNLGIAESRGEYLAFLDADDVWLPNKLERQVGILESTRQASMIYGAAEYWHGWTGDPDDRARDRVPPLGVEADTVHTPPALARALYPLGSGTAPCPSDLLLRRTAVERCGGFEESFVGYYQLYEDQAFLAKIYLHETVYVSGETWIKYRIHRESCSSIVARNGRYYSVRLFFLHWLEEYLRRQRIDDQQIWSAVRTALSTTLRSQEQPASPWRLRVGGASSARLDFPTDDAGTMRVEIENAGSGTSFDVQLNLGNLHLRAGGHYALRFQTRADAARGLWAGVAEAHEPWEGVGLYMAVAVTSEWQTVEATFVAEREERNARIHFDLGESPIAVELSSVGLFRLPQGQPITPSDAAGPGVLPVHDWRRVTPISRDWGWDRGLPIDRHYIERFLARHAEDIRGAVLEIADDDYTRRFGRDRVTASDVLHVSADHPRATLIGDLTDAPHLTSNRFDAIVLTQTLQFIFDTRAALATLHRILKPGGVLLATFPGLSKVSRSEWHGSWFWGFTTVSARRLFEEAFAPGAVAVESFGNVLSATAFLHGLAAQELRADELEYHDAEYELLIAVRAIKATDP